ncbi:YybH family protein [Ekhidna sp.]|uniref:YybH family protein n=1 Tax=Ekhidna sp. TaxID=2608089 RepID=UPI003C7C7249
MKISIFTLLLSVSLSCTAQSAQEEINQQVWTPFTRAWETNDGKAYNAVHTDDVWRINPGRLLIGDEYKKMNIERMTGQQRDRIIEFTFETRTANVDNAYEVGYYRITDRSEDEPKYFVGRFHVALKRVDGVWKIAQDWDTDEINGEKITAESLQKRDFIHFQ